MNEEKDLLENEIEETTAEVVEEVEETVDEVVDEVVEDATEITEEVSEVSQEVLEETPEIVEKSEISKSAVAIISAAITFAVCVIIVCVLYFTTYNVYNANKDGYVATIADFAEANGMTLEDLREEWSLPSNMPDNTTVQAAQAHIPTGRYIQLASGMTFEQFSEVFNFTEEDGIDENTPWGKTEKILSEKTKAAAQNQATEDEAAEDAAADGDQAPAENAEVAE